MTAGNVPCQAPANTCPEPNPARQSLQSYIPLFTHGSGTAQTAGLGAPGAGHTAKLMLARSTPCWREKAAPPRRTARDEHGASQLLQLPVPLGALILRIVFLNKAALPSPALPQLPPAIYSD